MFMCIISFLRHCCNFVFSAKTGKLVCGKLTSGYECGGIKEISLSDVYEEANCTAACLSKSNGLKGCCEWESGFIGEICRWYPGATSKLVNKYLAKSQFLKSTDCSSTGRNLVGRNEKFLVNFRFKSVE